MPIHLRYHKREVVDAVAFRGYLLEPPIHTWSPSPEILNYWMDSREKEHNGIFSVVRILNRGARLDLITDAFGVSPLYYRKMDSGVVFSTNPRFLITGNENPDWLGWRNLLHSKYFCTDRTIYREIRRVPAGTILRFNGLRMERIQWFRYHELPGGEKSITENAVDTAEELFQGAMRRCLRLGAQGSQTILPLSSGYDSRRIFAFLVKHRVPFKAMTVRILQKGMRDLDARFASQMCADFGIDHRVIEFPKVQEFVDYYRFRRNRFSGEAFEHTWIIPLMRALPGEPVLIFDGLAGDALAGKVAYKKPEFYSCHPRARVEAILQNLIKNKFGKVLDPFQWPTIHETREDIARFLERLPDNVNRAEIFFLLTRIRRATALMSQWLLPSGHTVVYPYLDLDHVKYLLNFHPLEKLRYSFQERCLQRHHPELYRYYGNRNFPGHLPGEDPWLVYQTKIQMVKSNLQEIRNHLAWEPFTRLLSPAGRFLASLSRYHQRVLFMNLSWLRPITDIFLTYLNRREMIRLESFSMAEMRER
ncbi:MAG: hypothetical protein GXO78_03735 [Calditrichaeota bacterium]|nr:hypothetical protein [Calditrichota bacterium]